MRRANEPGKGKWATPSGYIEFEDDYLSTAAREAKEETGLDVELQSTGAVGVAVTSSVGVASISGLDEPQATVSRRKAIVPRIRVGCFIIKGLLYQALLRRTDLLRCYGAYTSFSGRRQRYAVSLKNSSGAYEIKRYLLKIYYGIRNPYLIDARSEECPSLYPSPFFLKMGREENLPDQVPKELEQAQAVFGEEIKGGETSSQIRAKVRDPDTTRCANRWVAQTNHLGDCFLAPCGRGVAMTEEGDLRSNTCQGQRP